MEITKERLRINNYRKLFNDLKKAQYFGRLGKTFQTDDNYYFYDTGTGKIARLVVQAAAK